MRGTLFVTGEVAVDKLVNSDPLALLIAMVLDQQVLLEKAFRGPFDLRQRLGVPRLNAAALAGWDPDELITAFVTAPALHRYPAAMAGRVQKLCQLVVDQYGGKPERIWTKAADGADLLARVKALPGFGEQKAKIFVALLGKQVGVEVPGWREVSEPFGKAGSYCSVADITGPESLAKVRAYKQQMKAAAKAAKVAAPAS